jgi:hypothetical protein
VARIDLSLVGEEDVRPVPGEAGAEGPRLVRQERVEAARRRAAGEGDGEAAVCLDRGRGDPGELARRGLGDVRRALDDPERSPRAQACPA